MAELLEMMRVWIEAVIRLLGYPGIALVMLLENLFPPIPSELVMPFAGFLAARGELNFWGALAAGTLGATLGALALYGLGAWAGERLARPFVQRWGKWFLLSEEDFDRALQVFARFGLLAVLVGRLMPLVRSLISVPAGMKRIPLGPFLGFTLVGTTLWNLFLGGAGYLLGSRWNEIITFTKQYERGVLVVLGALIVGWIVFKLMRRSAPRVADEL